MNVLFNASNYYNRSIKDLSKENSSINNNQNVKVNTTNHIVYLKTDDMLYSGGSGNGLSFTIKYDENSSKENPKVKAKGIDESGNKFEKTININDIDPSNASIIEMRALENHLMVDKTGRLSTLPYQSSNMGLSDSNDFIGMFEEAIKEQIKLRQYDVAMIYRKSLRVFSDFTKKINRNL